MCLCLCLCLLSSSLSLSAPFVRLFDDLALGVLLFFFLSLSFAARGVALLPSTDTFLGRAAGVPLALLLLRGLLGATTAAGTTAAGAATSFRAAVLFRVLLLSGTAGTAAAAPAGVVASLPAGAGASFFLAGALFRRGAAAAALLRAAGVCGWLLAPLLAVAVAVLLRRRAALAVVVAAGADLRRAAVLLRRRGVRARLGGSGVPGVTPMMVPSKRRCTHWPRQNSSFGSTVRPLRVWRAATPIAAAVAASAPLGSAIAPRSSPVSLLASCTHAHTHTLFSLSHTLSV